MAKEEKEIIGWYQYTCLEFGIGINGDQYGRVVNYEPIFKGETVDDAIKRVKEKEQ